MYFASDEIDRLWQCCDHGGASRPVLIKQPFSKKITCEDGLLRTLKAWAAAARQGKAHVADISQLDQDALPGADDDSLDATIRRIESAWQGDWFAYVTDLHQYDGDLWERAIEILMPAVRKHGGLPAGGFRIEGFFGKYGSTPTGVHLDSSDNFSFIVRGPKRLVFWPRERFQGLVQLPERRAPSQELALTRRYEQHLHDAIILDGEAGDVIYWPKEYWHVGSSPEGWTAMVNLAMWWNARPITLARFVVNRVLDLDGDARLHPFNPDAVLAEALTPPSTISRPILDAVSQISAHSDEVARVVWASVATSCGFTTPPAKVQSPPVTDDTRVRVKYPVVPLSIGNGCVLVACGHQTRTPVQTLTAGCLQLNGAIGAEYSVRDLAEVLGGSAATNGTREECTRLISELIAFRAFEVVHA